MSMSIDLARVSPEAFDQVKADPSLVGALVVEQNGDGRRDYVIGVIS